MVTVMGGALGPGPPIQVTCLSSWMLWPVGVSGYLPLLPFGEPTSARGCRQVALNLAPQSSTDKTAKVQIRDMSPDATTTSAQQKVTGAAVLLQPRDQRGCADVRKHLPVTQAEMNCLAAQLRDVESRGLLSACLFLSS